MFPSNAPVFSEPCVHASGVPGALVEQFEQIFENRFPRAGNAVSTASDTDALLLAYKLAGLKPGDEVAVPVFTSANANITLLRMGCKLCFVDVDPDTLNINTDHLQQVVNEHTKAIVCIHYGGLPCNMKQIQAIALKYNIPVIEDARQALGAAYRGKQVGGISDFTVFSFETNRHIDTRGGGMLMIKDPALGAKTAYVRWPSANTGITDARAAIGIAAIAKFEETLAHRRMLLAAYEKGLNDIPGISLVGRDYPEREHAAFLCAVLVYNRAAFTKMLSEHGLESGRVDFRNDRLKSFGGHSTALPCMDAVENKYTMLPLHTGMSECDVNYICGVIKKGW